MIASTRGMLLMCLGRLLNSTPLPLSRSDWVDAKKRSYIEMEIKKGKAVILMRNTFTECRDLGVRT
jgi:hypothetical protein